VPITPHEKKPDQIDIRITAAAAKSQQNDMRLHDTEKLYPG
jgi:hypothetical protein